MDFRCFTLTSKLPPNPLRHEGLITTYTYTKSNNQATLASISFLRIESLPGQGKSLETRREIIEKVSFTHFFWNERTTDPRGKKETLSLYQAPNWAHDGL